MPIFLDLFLGVPRYTIYFFQDILLGGSGYPFQVLAPFRPEASGLHGAVGFPLLSLTQFTEK
jgi:hypothetical protein